MRYLAALLLLALVGCSGCAQRDFPFPAGLPGIPLDLDPSIALATVEGGGHACAVGGHVLTARHVMQDRQTRQYVAAAWSDGRGSEGFASVVVGHAALDIALLDLMVTRGDGVVFLSRGEAKVGDRVYWFEYDFRTRPNAMRARRRVAKVLRIVAQHYILDDVPVGGASGSCLINEQGQAVGIVVAGYETTQDGLGVGIVARLPEDLEYR